jgi:hypothetical protein
MMLGCKTRAISNNTRTIFSPSPIHLLTSEDEEMAKNRD